MTQASNDNSAEDVFAFLHEFRTFVDTEVAGVNRILHSKNRHLRRLNENRKAVLAEKEAVEKELITVVKALKKMEKQRKMENCLYRLNIQTNCLDCDAQFDARTMSSIKLCPQGHTVCKRCLKSLGRCPSCNAARALFTETSDITKVKEFIECKEYALDMFKKCKCKDCALSDHLNPLQVRAKNRVVAEKKYLFIKSFENRIKLTTLEQGLDYLNRVCKRTDADVKSFVKGVCNEILTVKHIMMELGVLSAGSPVQTPAHIDEDAENFQRFALCTCPLRCPHPLPIERHGKIVGEACACVQKGLCVCVTHTVTLYVTIKGGSTGAVKINLAGRGFPNTTNRFYKAVKSNFYANMIVDEVVKDQHIVGGQFSKAGKLNTFVYRRVDLKLDLTSVKLPARKYAFAFCDGPTAQDLAYFRILTGSVSDHDPESVYRNFIHRLFS